MNIASNFLATAKKFPNKPFLVSPDGKSNTYYEILSKARRFASFLEVNRIAPGARVILAFPNSVEYICAYLGSLFCSCTLVLVDFLSRPNHIEYVKKNSNAAVWIAPFKREEYNAIQDGLLYPENLGRYPEMPLNKLCSKPNPEALIMYTSGSTGMPKGVILSHANLLHTVKSITSWAKINSNDRELTTLSLSHLFGLAHFHIYWTLGGTIFIEEKLQNIPIILEKLSKYEITSFPGTPGGFKIIVDQYPDLFRKHGQELKYIIVNSAPMKAEYISRILSLLPKTKFYMYYGLTEASRSSYICYNEHPNKLETVGQPTPGSEIRIESPSTPFINKPGEILIRGPHITKGYIGMDSSPFFKNGWLKTGDLGIMDEDGFLTWKGRLKEQINIDGLKLTPVEVETILLKHEDVIDCAVIGVPDELTGESVIAFVVTQKAPDKKLAIDIRRFCKSYLDIYKIPKKIIFIDKIPRTDSGKTKRYLLKEELNK